MVRSSQRSIQNPGCWTQDLDLDTHSPGTEIHQAAHTGHGQTDPPPPISIDADNSLGDETTASHVIAGNATAHFAVDWDVEHAVAVHTQRSLHPLGVRDCSCTSNGSGGVQGYGGKHLRGRVDEVHGLHDSAVEFVKVETLDAVVGVCFHDVCLLDRVSVLMREKHGVCLGKARKKDKRRKGEERGGGGRGNRIGGATYFKRLALVVARVGGRVGLARLGQQLSAVNSKWSQRQRAVGVDGVGAVLPLHDGAWAGGVGSWKRTC